MPKQRRVRERDPWIVRVTWSLVPPIWGFALLYFMFNGRNVDFFPLGLSKNPDYSPFVVAFLLSMLLLLLVFVVLKKQSSIGKSLAEIQNMKPDVFEDWVAARFRGLGYSVKVAGSQGDHGADLVVEKDGQTSIVQCKNYRAWSVGEPILRDLYGAMHDFGAEKAFLVTTGRMTQAARNWAQGKPIEIWDGDEVARLSKGVSTSASRNVTQLTFDTTLSDLSDGTEEVRTPAPPFPSEKGQSQAPAKCPKCGAGLVVKRNRATGESFLACPGFPSCRYTEAMPRHGTDEIPI